MGKNGQNRGKEKRMKKKKGRLSISLIASLVSFVISTGISFFLTPFLINRLGKEVYSFYGMANEFVSYITVISIALNSMTSKYISVEIVRGNAKRAKEYFVSTLLSNVILCSVLTPILTIIVLNLNSVLQISTGYYTQVQILFGMVFLAMIVRLISSVYGSATYAANRMDLKAYTDIGKSLLKVILYIIAFSAFTPSIISVGLVLLFLEIYNSAICISLSKKLLPEMKLQRGFFNVRLIFKTLKIGIWNSLNHLGDLLLSSSDMLMANILISESAAGNISIIKTMPSLISGIITSINSVFMPRMAQIYGRHEKDDLIKEVQMAQRIMSTIVTPIVVTLMVFGYDFYNLWVPGNNINLLAELSAIDISRMLIIGAVWPVANLNIITDKVKIPSLLVIGCGIANVLSMAIMVKTTAMGIFVIPITTLIITILFYGAFIPVYPCSLLGISKTSFLKPVVNMLIASICSGIFSSWIHSCIEILTWLDLFFWGGICGLLSLVISALTIVGVKNILKLIK